MSKLTLEALKERAGAVASTELLNSISGGTENACHDGGSTRELPPTREQDGTSVRKPIIKGL
ncbi:hypothetical protein MWU76_12505 [Gelidibacter sp. F2691]|nr:hypothetical protein [Gelidibacter sp. F2691]